MRIEQTNIQTNKPITTMDLFSYLEPDQKEFSVQDGAYHFDPNFFIPKYADALLERLTNKILWKQESMNMYGKKIDFPRLSAWYGDKEKSYSFSGTTYIPNPWTKELLYIKEQIEPIAKANFNSVLLNLYRDGQDSMSWHADDEKELGINPIIASVNFGDTRTFQLKHNNTKEKISLNLSHGSLLIMKGEMQHHWKHQVPKTKKKKQPRINLTFRFIK